jgi:hypothetical protein
MEEWQRKLPPIYGFQHGAVHSFLPLSAFPADAKKGTSQFASKEGSSIAVEPSGYWDVTNTRE